jgi:hypothetical protein
MKQAVRIWLVIVATIWLPVISKSQEAPPPSPPASTPADSSKAAGKPAGQETTETLPTMPTPIEVPAPTLPPGGVDGSLPPATSTPPPNGNGSLGTTAVLSDSDRAASSMGIEAVAMGEGMNPRPRIGYAFTWYPDEPMGNNQKIGIWRQDLNVSTPVYKDTCDVLTFSTGVRNEILDTDANLPVLGTPFPSDLWNIHLGGGYLHQFSNNWTGGLNLQVGSASDRPFENFNQMTIGATGSLRIPVRERDALILTLTYSNNSDFANNIPIPGIAYFWWPSDQFRALIGIPFAHLWWEPVDKLTVDLSYRLLYTVTGRVSYRFLPRWKLYAGYSLGNESYFLAENPQDDDRLFYSEQRVYGGLAWILDHRLSLDLTSGLAFDRFYSVGQNFQENQSQKLPVDAGPYISLALQWRF